MDSFRIHEISRLIKRNRWGHWLWTGYINEKGYGRVSYQGKFWRVHRLAWVLDGRPLEDDDDLHHLCRYKNCCNPEHLARETHDTHGKMHGRGYPVSTEESRFLTPSEQDHV